ncbi:hypothetical protein G6O67_003307 [Ophiocordyceps sinensis]|uniref:Uncharacterized protein n=1 Tax=Ophiocordyceps sinensis TaxID=72228 RepID=A0A8H4V8G4_9HYPO|nr:hypothetical protein G6O67_003307 [Ophiocordyceps sinensis]
MIEFCCVWEDARSSRCVQCNSRGDLCEPVPGMMSGDMTDLCAIRGKIVELWNQSAPFIQGTLDDFVSQVQTTDETREFAAANPGDMDGLIRRFERNFKLESLGNAHKPPV